MTEINKSSQQLIKESNMKLVFALIHSHGAISRADIKKITGLDLRIFDQAIIFKVAMMVNKYLTSNATKL